MFDLALRREDWLFVEERLRARPDRTPQQPDAAGRPLTSSERRALAATCCRFQPSPRAFRLAIMIANRSCFEGAAMGTSATRLPNIAINCHCGHIPLFRSLGRGHIPLFQALGRGHIPIRLQASPPFLCIRPPAPGTIMIYTHIADRGPLGVVSPPDR